MELLDCIVSLVLYIQVAGRIGTQVLYSNASEIFDEHNFNLSLWHPDYLGTLPLPPLIPLAIELFSPFLARGMAVRYRTVAPTRTAIVVTVLHDRAEDLVVFTERRLRESRHVTRSA